MEHVKSFNEFVGEEAVKGEDSKVYVDNVYIQSMDSHIKAAEILGVIKSSETEKEFLDYFYKEYGNGAFTEEEISTLSKYFNEYEEEDNLDAAEKEEEEEKAADAASGAEGGGEEPAVEEPSGVTPEDIEELENEI
jgi:hypothetical protein